MVPPGDPTGARAATELVRLGTLDFDEITSSGKRFKVSEGKRNEEVSGVSESGVSDIQETLFLLGNSALTTLC